MTIDRPAEMYLAPSELPWVSAIVSRNDCAVRLSAGTCQTIVAYEPNWPTKIASRLSFCSLVGNGCPDASGLVTDRVYGPARMLSDV